MFMTHPMPYAPAGGAMMGQPPLTGYAPPGGGPAFRPPGNPFSAAGGLGPAGQVTPRPPMMGLGPNPTMNTAQGVQPGMGPGPVMSPANRPMMANQFALANALRRGPIP